MGKTWTFAGYEIKLSWHWKQPEHWTNRHGGGWAWKLGFCTSNPLRDIVIYLLWGSIRIRREKFNEQ